MCTLGQLSIKNNVWILALDYGELNRAGYQSVQEDTVPAIDKDLKTSHLLNRKQSAGNRRKNGGNYFREGKKMEFLKVNTLWKCIDIKMLLVVENYKLQLTYTMSI